MPDPDSFPYVDWPRHLQESWHDCAQRGEVDAHNPPNRMVKLIEENAVRSFHCCLVGLLAGHPRLG